MLFASILETALAQVCPFGSHSIRLPVPFIEFMQKHIEPIMTRIGRERIASHSERGDRPIIITATNRFVTGPIAQAFGVGDLIATEPEIIDGRYTGVSF